MGEGVALLAMADPRAIAALDHPGTRLDDLHSVVLHVVNRLKIRANLDAPGASTLRIELKNAETEHVWMNCRVIRDREAPGSNPGPPTNGTLRFVPLCLNSARIRGPHGFQPCAIDLA